MPETPSTNVVELINRRFDDISDGMAALDNKVSALVDSSARNAARSEAHDKRIEEHTRRIEDHELRLKLAETKTARHEGAISVGKWLGSAGIFGGIITLLLKKLGLAG